MWFYHYKSRKEVFMEAKECIMGRRSIRKFKDTPVSKETIEELVSLAAYGPTWKNCQANRFIAITDKETKSKIAQLGTLGYDGNTRIIEGAPLIMVMTKILKKNTEKYKLGFNEEVIPSTN